MTKAVWLAKRNYWIAGIGAIISAFSFLAFTFLNVSYSYSLPDLGTGSTTPGTSITVPVSALQLASSEGFLWIAMLLVLAVLGVGIVFLVRRNPFGSRAPVEVQGRWTAVGFVVAGALSAICVVASLLAVQQYVQGILGSYGSSISNYVQFTFTWGFGAYVFLLGAATIVVAGVMEVISPVKMLSDTEMATRWNYPQNQYPQNQYNYPSAPYGSTPMGQPQPFVDPNSQYNSAGSAQQYPGYPAFEGQSYPPLPGQQPPAGPYQPPSQYPPYGQ